MARGKSVELRRAVAADAAAIRELTREAYAKWVPVIGREPKPMTADYAEALRTNRFDVLFVDGKLAALIETVVQADCLLIENVAVSPAFQGRGLSRQLMAHAGAARRIARCGEVRLYTNKLFAEEFTPLPKPRLSRGQRGAVQRRLARRHEQEAGTAGGLSGARAMALPPVERLLCGDQAHQEGNRAPGSPNRILARRFGYRATLHTEIREVPRAAEALPPRPPAGAEGPFAR